MSPDASLTANNNRRAVQVQFTTKTPRSEWEGILYYKQSAVWTLRSVANEEGGSGKIKKQKGMEHDGGYNNNSGGVTAQMIINSGKSKRRDAETQRLRSPPY